MRCRRLLSFLFVLIGFFQTAAQRAGDKKDNDSTVSGVDSGLVRDMRGVGYVGV